MKKPVLIPQQYQREVFALSKAALADLAWDLAATNCQNVDNQAQVLAALRERWAIVVAHRKIAAALARYRPERKARSPSQARRAGLDLG